MSLISDLIPVVDSARQMIADIGVRVHSIQLVHLDWGTNGVGIGTPVKTVVDVTPTPKVLKYTTEQQVESGGAITDSDLNITKISARYTLDELSGGELPKGQEFFWSIDGVLHIYMGYQKRALGWNIRVRRTNRNA